MIKLHSRDSVLTSTLLQNNSCAASLKEGIPFRDTLFSVARRPLLWLLWDALWPPCGYSVVALGRSCNSESPPSPARSTYEATSGDSAAESAHESPPPTSTRPHRASRGDTDLPECLIPSTFHYKTVTHTLRPNPSNILKSVVSCTSALPFSRREIYVFLVPIFSASCS